MNQQITEQQAIEERQKYVTAFNDTMIKGVFYKLRVKERSKESAYVFNLIFRTPLYVNKRGNEKTIQTIHKTLHKPYISLILRALRNV